METLILVSWIVAAVVVIGSVLWFVKSKKKKPVEKEIFSAPLNTEELKVEPKMPEMPKEDEGVEEAEEEEEYKEE